MKKKTYVWLASLLLMLVATLTSCEKFALDDSGTNSHDANANVIIHASVAKNNSTGTRSGEEDFEDEEDGDEDGSEEGDEEIEGKPLEDYCSRISIAIFDGEEKVKTLNLKAEDGYEDIGFNLDAGKYRMVAIGHNGSGNCTISSPEKVKFYKNKMTDTFFYYGTFNVRDGEDTDDYILLKRAVAQFKVHITDATIPAEAHSIKFYYTGGSSTLDAVTGYGCVQSRQTESFKLQEGKRDYSVYTFPREENKGLKMTINILDADAQSIKEYSKEVVPVKRNNITQTNISIKDHTISDPDQKEDGDSGKGNLGFTVNPDWEGEIVVEFE
ncbi:FimB/Mfa2 family fimbrial subunit [Segatella copri]|uniref:FimB/Mfa2 family fimbrial subunit n=1 Tax=Segatella copri TaxID=165179 RepID=UPI0022E5A4FA|nr:FimB/Mfa2 family fimbrial subunit [Segatella copri]